MLVDKATNKHVSRRKNYLDCLIIKVELKFEDTKIVCKHYQLKTQSALKVLLSYSYDKKHIVPNGIETVALGHFSI